MLASGLLEKRFRSVAATVLLLFANCSTGLLAQSAGDGAAKAVIQPAGFPAALPETSSGFPTSEKHESQESPFSLGPGDLLEVSVYGIPELNTKARVGNTGEVYLPLIDYVHVAGLSV